MGYGCQRTSLVELHDGYLFVNYNLFLFYVPNAFPINRLKLKIFFGLCPDRAAGLPRIDLSPRKAHAIYFALRVAQIPIARAVLQVFISYRWEDQAHCDRVYELAKRLEAEGITVILDRFANERTFHGGGPDEGWPAWCVKQAEHGRVIVIGSSGWFSRYAPDPSAPPANGLGAAAEAGVIRQRIYNLAGVNPDIRIVTFGRTDSHTFPIDLQRYHGFADPDDFSNLVCWLKGIPIVTPPAPDWPDARPALLWPMADHADVRAALEQLLTRQAPWRLLSLRGPSEAGKSHITRQILRNALKLPGLACGRFDFKGTTDVEAELRALVQELKVPFPATGASLNARLSQVLDSLRQRRHPALLIFDTYEAASGEAQNWIEKQLLYALIRSPWLRIVIAGQLVPSRTGALWEDEACDPLELKPPPPAEWLVYGQTYKTGLNLKLVRKVHKLCGGRPSLLAKVFGPAN